ncbi:vesicle-associated protein 2-1 [Tripterygium wilfordii]|uniref:Vesicle-associated protein 2-1 n=1 Tax=Tripterygium wilfordii TaxID=458696 RepID=A0A7J7CM17_TRIWF|nr:vesicle-associated protein 2-1-like [Tripterygium wilfordii]KAF5735123.1 vesicle-associated protein 2-1 [Tripterygium wilfordii]
MTAAGSNNQFISVHPDELKFIFELEKPSYCDLKVVNKTEHHVAFKVKTTSPKKYFVRPNTGVIQPWDSSVIRVTLQAQQEYPPNMQCKDKFMIQSTVVPPHSDVDELPQDTFNKDSGKTVEECKLRVVFNNPTSDQRNSGDFTLHSSTHSPDTDSTLRRLKEERDAAAQQTAQLQQELDMLKRRRYRRSDPGFSFKFAIFVGIIGMLVGLLLNLSLSSPATE